MFESLTKTRIGGSAPVEEEKKVNKIKKSSEIDDSVKNLKKNNKKCKTVGPVKLRKVALTLTLTAAGIIVVTKLVSCGVGKYNESKPLDLSNEDGYEVIMDSNEIRTSTIYQLIDEPTTSLDELLDKDKAQYEEYEKFRNMLRAKAQYIDPLMGNLQNYEVKEVSYNDIDDKMIADLNAEYYSYYTACANANLANDTATYESEMAKFDEVCVKLNSISHAINAYQEKYGNDLVVAIANKVLASKVIDSAGDIIPAGVSDIQGTYNEDGTMNVTFKYNDMGNSVTVVSDTFQGTDITTKLAQAVASNSDLDAIHATKTFAMDDYKVGSEKKVGR